jgi:phosphatidylglycerol:prolipoprotein diacylglycerol transferase
MHPILFTFHIPFTNWNPTVHGYGLMLALGFLAGILVAAWRARRDGVNPDHVYNLGIVALLGGIVGSRLFDVIEYTTRYPDWLGGFNLLGGLDLWWTLGGLAGAALAADLGLLPGPRRVKKHFIISIACWAVLGALVVGRAGFIMHARSAALAAGADPNTLPFEGFIDALAVTSGGLTAYGGMLLAVVAAIPYLIYARRRYGVNPLQLLDIMAPSLALGLAFGRLGCFLNGCCYGGPTDLPWGITWPAGSIPYEAGLHGPVHPAQLYSALNAFLIFLVLHLGYCRKWRHGLLLGVFFALMSISRFLLEMLRVDEAKIYMGGLSISQAVGIFVFAGVIIYFLWLHYTKLSDLRGQPFPAATPSGPKPPRTNRKG